MMNGQPLKIFIDEPISVVFLQDLVLEKKPHWPDKFIWHDELFEIENTKMEWVDFTRRGRMARNMSETHSTTAAVKGSWGVGRFFFRVRTVCGRTFDIYYDRTPKGSLKRKGQWFLFQELLI